MSDDRTQALGLKISLHAVHNLDAIAEQQHTSKTGALEYALAFAARPASERASTVLGRLDAARVEQALDCWTNQLARATENNSKAFAPPEWCLIADVCNGMLWEPGIENPAVMIAANVADGHHLDGTGYKWLSDEATELDGSLERVGAGKPTPAMREIDKQVSALVKRIAALDGPHAWAIVAAVQWFWDHCADDIAARDPWWTLQYRRRWTKREGR